MDIPIDTHLNYDETKGLKYGNALKKSRVVQEGGTLGMAGGFNTGVNAPAKGGKAAKGDDDSDDDFAGGYARDPEEEDRRAGVLMAKQTIGGRIKEPVEGDPVYMLGAFRDSEYWHLFHLTFLLLQFCAFVYPFRPYAHISQE